MLLAGCASTQPSQSESQAPTGWSVTQQPAIAGSEQHAYYVLCADCPGPTPKTPFTQKSRPSEHEALDGLGTGSLNTKANTPVLQAKILYTAHFAFGTAQLSPADRQALQDLLPELRQAQITIVGHTDSVGPQDFNDWLALRRAQFVKDHLVSLGLDPERIHVGGQGRCCYLQDNDTLHGRAANRRAEVRLTTLSKSPITLTGEKQP